MGDSYMNDILDKLGLYDLVGVLLPGTIATGFSIIVDSAFFHCGLSTYCGPNNSILFLVISYLVGLLLQEMGNWIYRNLFNRDYRILKRVLGSCRGQRGLLLNEKEGIYKAVSKRLTEADMEDEKKIYNFCRNAGGDSEKAEKDLMIGTLSRSLFLYFFFLSVIMFAHAFIQKDLVNYLIDFIFLLIAIILWNRSIRFYEKRYVRILQHFYYSNANPSSTSK